MEKHTYKPGAVTAICSDEKVQLCMSQSEFNFLREALRELRRVVEPWELSSLTGWEVAEIDHLIEDLWRIAEENQIEM